MSETIKHITCVTDNFPDGQKICAARIEYDRAIDAGKLNPASFEVAGRHITGIHAEGDEVILDLDILDPAAFIIPEPKGPGPKGKDPGGPGGPGKPPMGGPPKLPAVSRAPREVRVTQKGDVFAADGSVIPGSDEAIVSDLVVEPVIEDFRQFEFGGLGYNLYEPKDPKPGERYPLVVFIHDAGPCGDDTKITLSQGGGAVAWAKPAWQKEHPCFVLAPQIPRQVKLTKDSFEVSDELEILKSMIDDVAAKYPVDPNRIYATGQSMGCMAFCELNIRYPDYFAASLLVAGQWSPERMAEKCAGNKLWILVSEHDEKAFPGMNAVTEAMEKAGARIGRYKWDAKAAPEELDALTAEAMKDDVNIRYTVFEGSSVVPPWKDDNPATNHVCTWAKAYTIRGLMEWLFSNHK